MKGYTEKKSMNVLMGRMLRVQGPRSAGTSLNQRMLLYTGASLRCLGRKHRHSTISLHMHCEKNFPPAHEGGPSARLPPCPHMNEKGDR